MKYVTAVLVGAVLVGLAVGTTEAGQNHNAALLSHVIAIAQKTNCTSFLTGLTGCDDLNPNFAGAVGENAAVGVFIGIDPGTGTGLNVVGLDFGVTYTAGTGGAFITSWQSCGDLDSPQEGWPASGTGNSVVWNECRTGNLVLAGWFSVYVYTDGRLTIGPHPLVGQCQSLDCDGANFDLLVNPVTVSLNGGGGVNPTCGVPVKPTTWGSIKTIYGN